MAQSSDALNKEISVRLRWDWARPCHILARTGLTPPTSAPGLGLLLPQLHRGWARLAGNKRSAAERQSGVRAGGRACAHAHARR
jgi:hypothetical protein